MMRLATLISLFILALAPMSGLDAGELRGTGDLGIVVERAGTPLGRGPKGQHDR